MYFPIWGSIDSFRYMLEVTYMPAASTLEDTPNNIYSNRDHKALNRGTLFALDSDSPDIVDGCSGQFIFRRSQDLTADTVSHHSTNLVREPRDDTYACIHVYIYIYIYVFVCT